MSANERNSKPIYCCAYLCLRLRTPWDDSRLTATSSRPTPNPRLDLVSLPHSARVYICIYIYIYSI